MPWWSRAKSAPAEAPESTDPLARFLIGEVRRRGGPGVALDEKALTRIEEAASRARTELGRGSAQSQVLLPFLGVTPDGPMHFDAIITRADLERIDQASASAPEP